MTLTEYTVELLSAALGVNVATFVVPLYAVVPATAPDDDVTAIATEVASIAWLKVAETTEDVATFVAPAAGTDEVTDGGTTPAVVNVQLFGGVNV